MNGSGVVEIRIIGSRWRKNRSLEFYLIFFVLENLIAKKKGQREKKSKAIISDVRFL